MGSFPGAGCHLADERGTALGNIDLSSFDALMRRRDVLPPQGPYPVGLLLMKAGEQPTVLVQTWDVDPTSGETFARIATDVRHNAGSAISISSEAVTELRRWIAAGYTRSGLYPEALVESRGDCVNEVPAIPAVFGSIPTAGEEAYTRFLDVQPILRENCAGSSCHGRPFADFYLTCGDTDEQRQWNYFVALQHLHDPASTSEILRRPLAKDSGGTFHEGGDVIPATDDERYTRLLDWAEWVVENRPALIGPPPMADEGLRFFANRVQPVLVRKGCMFTNCHSPSMFHDLRLQGGSQGVFSNLATLRNYDISRLQLAVESPDPNDSRIIAKNLYPPDDVGLAPGLAHRGGSLFEDFGVVGPGVVNSATPDDCAGSADPHTGDLNMIPAYCVLIEWHRIEREAAIARGEIMADTVDRLVWVTRGGDAGDVRDFDTFRGGADLVSADVTVNADGSIGIAGGSSLLGSCGLSSPDVRNPAVSWDGTRVAFAARSSASEPLRIYEITLAGGACRRLDELAPSAPTANGILTHDFDPAYAPDGRIVFASSRGNLGTGYPYEGPQRTPASMQPNANLYIWDGTSVRQLTFLLNQEVAPSFMADGRVIFTTEKREPEMHQLALRRQNLDGGDYHPLFAQRDSFGFDAAQSVVELPNRNLAFVGGPITATDGAGTLVVVNRSLGPDQRDRDPADRFYLHAMTQPAPGAFGRIPDVPAGPDTGTAFRSPAALPTGWIVASCGSGTGPFSWQLCQIDTITGAVSMLGPAGVDPVAVYARPDRGVFRSRVDEANSTTRVESGENAVVRILDFPMLSTLLFANTRIGRPIDPRIGGFDLFEALPPGVSGDHTASDATGSFAYRRLGHADLNGDGSAAIQIPGGRPVLFRVTDGGGSPLVFDEGGRFTGELMQREEYQFYPGEQANQMVPRRFFNNLCGGCHGSISGRELDVAVNVDVLTSASESAARDQTPMEMR